ncbi:uncharacterized protein LOC8276105 [Ricinus communis]|uniref:Wall-associated receptor kinase C-terminal domain-containing protein n=1 Tax=Ricinus communis TaxID=3988 RepID=B9T5T7_RICCO|nr:uncharacterized protein LOC8276105 [Ricinus communis]EEF28775.1 hypothetical protein RCOM_1180720 [Ricinus communis]|eukprot:XP_002533606.1 uncharacterized protein LOC8276105 [Ricinus communis]
MQTFKKLKFIHYLLSILNLCFITCLSHHISTSFCGKIPIQSPFLSSNSTVSSSLLKHMILCSSQKLFFRTSLGLFPVSSIDYATKTITISQPSCPSSQQFVSPSLLSAGFPTSPMLNSLILFNCSNKNYPITSSFSNCKNFKACSSSSDTPHQELKIPYSCLLVNNLDKLDKSFHPKDLNCSHYSRIYRSSLNDDDNSIGYELGTRISFDIPDHVPNICDECEKPNGNCGVGLKCICHPKECKNKVISTAGSIKPSANIVIFSMLPLIVLVFFTSCS